MYAIRSYYESAIMIFCSPKFILDAICGLSGLTCKKVPITNEKMSTVKIPKIRFFNDFFAKARSRNNFV